MRFLAGLICIIVAISFLGLPFIGMMILFYLFALLVEYAFGGKK